jgi:outer membrane protein TolC
MKLPEAIPSTTRFLPLAALGLVAALSILPTRGSGQQPAPTAPTIPTPTVRTHATGYQALNQPPTPLPVPNAEPKTEPAKIPELTLGECITIALERQPAIQAVRKRMEATEASLRGLNGIGRIGQVFSPDLPVRKEQASRGITAAAADLQKVHNEVVQDVTRLYYSVVYARQQEYFADDVAGQLEVLVKIMRDIVNSKMPENLTNLKLDVAEIGLDDARTIRKQTQIGREQAMAALREAMAVCDTDFPFRVKDEGLPLMEQKEPLPKEKVIELALERRPELALAAAGVDAFRLEVYAQGRLHFRRAVPTLASGADIHAQEVPQALRTLKDYRPGAIPPEMPPQLVGTKYDRVSRAMAYSQRAESVYEKARNLVVLEAETGFYDLDLASHRLNLAKDKNERGKSMTTYVTENFRTSKEKDVLFQVYVAGSKARADFVEAVYQHILALAAIERITAGGVCPKFPGR